jgi:sulfite reductase alpha subunit-like flavoprotein
MHSRDSGDQKVLASYAANYSSFMRMQYSLLGKQVHNIPLYLTFAADVLETMPSIKLLSDNEQKNAEILSVFLGLLGPIKPRYYSVANYPEVSPTLLRIVYKVSYAKSPLTTHIPLGRKLQC